MGRRTGRRSAAGSDPPSPGTTGSAPHPGQHTTYLLPKGIALRDDYFGDGLL